MTNRLRTAADGTQERHCLHCDSWLPWNEGSWYRHKRPGGTIGLRPDRCKSCHCKRAMEWQAGHHDHILEQRKQRRLAKKYAKIGHKSAYGRRHLRTNKRPPGIPSLAVLLGV